MFISLLQLYTWCCTDVALSAMVSLYGVVKKMFVLGCLRYGNGVFVEIMKQCCIDKQKMVVDSVAFCAGMFCNAWRCSLEAGVLQRQKRCQATNRLSASLPGSGGTRLFGYLVLVTFKADIGFHQLHIHVALAF